jgi:hypothetical protein
MMNSQSSASLYSNSFHCSKAPENMDSEEEKIDMKKFRN